MISRICLAALLAATVARADASALVLWPIDPKIEAGQSATMLWVENRGAEPVSLQIRSLGWSQANGEDVHQKQHDVVASPPIAKVAPGQRQLVRIIRRLPTGASGQAQASYRLLIDELPPPIDDDNPTAARAHLAVQMRYSIPLFVHAGTAPKPRLSGRVVVDHGKRFIEVRNQGAGFARLINLRVRQGARDVVINAGLVGYVLAGAAMRWPLPGEAPVGGTLVVSVNGDDTVLGPSA